VFEWSIDHSGELAAVVKFVEDAKLEPYKKLVRDPIKGEHVEVDVYPSDEDLADFERARASLLSELADVRTPFAGVFAGYRDNRSAIGGYHMAVSVAAYERWE